MSADLPHLAEAVSMVLDHALGHEAGLGVGRLVCIDGPAGSGKTTLADAVLLAGRRRVTSTALVHLDDLYEGWSGLGAGVTQRIESGILRPLPAGDPGRYRRWDWYAGEWAEEHVVEPVALLLLEGVGAAATAYDDLVTTRVWVDAPRDLRLQRGLARGGVDLTDRWERWLDEEQQLFVTEATQSRADVLVDGTGSTPPRLARP